MAEAATLRTLNVEPMSLVKSLTLASKPEFSQVNGSAGYPPPHP